MTHTLFLEIIPSSSLRRWVDHVDSILAIFVCGLLVFRGEPKTLTKRILTLIVVYRNSASDLFILIWMPRNFSMTDRKCFETLNWQTCMLSRWYDHYWERLCRLHYRIFRSKAHIYRIWLFFCLHWLFNFMLLSRIIKIFIDLHSSMWIHSLW